MHTRLRGWSGLHDRKRRLALASFFVVAAFASPARAIISQVDGTVVPVSTRLQECLDKNPMPSAANPAPGEGAGVLDAIRNAAIVPQTFTPAARATDGRRIVSLTDVGEGGGFRNRFGWYHVGDNPYLTASRHEIYGCRDRNIAVGCTCPCPAGPRGAAPVPAPRCTNWVNANIVDVDFDCLRTAGEWRGGPIAFYILTPEPVRVVPCATNADCTPLGVGAYCSGSRGCILGAGCPPIDSTTTRVYSTDNAVNDDGDYVHFLIYTSRTFPNAYYFGFEDLFRGGDNDFEDLLIRAIGLVPTCNPTPEACDGRDNDCDGMIDEGVAPGGPCGVAVGECRAGMLMCEMGRFVCRGTTGPTPETCDGRDNDCDGVVDDGDPGGGMMCTRTPEGLPLCRAGTLRCRGGRLVCEGGLPGVTESCDCEDNNCDGRIDEPPTSGNLCAGGGSCIACACRTPCAPGEFPCSSGLVCVSGFCVPPPCGAMPCRDDQACQAGRCVDACSIVTCPSGTVCRASGGMGRCVENNCYGLGCTDPAQICLGGMCQTDPCQDVNCPAGQFCRGGECVATCAGVRCGARESCRDGACVGDPCAGIVCSSGQTCNADGVCVPDPCANRGCGALRVCRDGQCVDDPCGRVNCPGAPEIVCREGQCVDRVPLVDYPRERVVGTGHGGISCTAGFAHGAESRRGRLWGLAGILVAVAAGRRGRRRRRSHRVRATVLASLCRAPAPRTSNGVRVQTFITAGLLALSVQQSGCRPEPYCLNCEGGVTEDAESRDRAAIEVACMPTGPEACDRQDNDCDGETDEGFDLQTDPRNCGACGTLCNVPHAAPACVAGRCSTRRCDVGYWDLDRNPANGCEYACNPSGTTEVCDGRDNDCNGRTDEGFDLQNDVNHCGMCGNACRFTRGAGACRMGRCSLTMCEDGYVDLDRNPTTGCEYACRATGAEVCDGRDNDCNGMVDERCLRTFPATDVRLDQAAGNSIRPVISGDGVMTVGVAYMDVRNGESDVFFTRSGDNGSNWAPDVRVDRDAMTRDSVGPALGFASNRVVVAWSDFRTSTAYREVYSNTSADRGATFGAADVRANTGTGDAYNLRMIVAPGRVVAVWEELQADRSRQIRFARSGDGGASWMSGRVDHAGAGRIAALPAITSGGMNDVFVAWHDNRNGRNDVFVNRSVDGGVTWTANDTRMDSDAAGSHASESASVAADTAGHVYVAWQEVRTGRSWDVYSRISSDRGATFGAADRRLDTVVFDSDSVSPIALALSRNRAVVVYQDLRWGRANIYATATADGGATWLTSDVQVMGGRGRSNAIDLVASAVDDSVFVAWSDDRDGRRDLYVNYSNDAGLTFQPDDVRMDSGAAGAADSETPAIFAAPGRIAHVVWVDRRANGITGDIYYRSLRP